jgi:hypothetical protein
VEPVTGTDHLANHVAQAIAMACAERDAEIKRLRRALAFFASVIKCGEAWSDTCDQAYREAIGK